MAEKGPCKHGLGRNERDGALVAQDDDVVRHGLVPDPRPDPLGGGLSGATTRVRDRRARLRSCHAVAPSMRDTEVARAIG
jgi:hypothetical protein